MLGKNAFRVIRADPIGSSAHLAPARLCKMASAADLRIPEHERFVLDPICISCTRPEDDPSTFAVSRLWKLVLHPDQTVPGAVLLVARRHVPRLSDLTEAEGVEFFEVVKALEAAMETALTATMVNFQCLRNWSFRDDDPTPPFKDGHPNPHVHWHVAPRYLDGCVILGERFSDPCFGDELVWRSRYVEATTQAEIIRLLQVGLGLR